MIKFRDFVPPQEQLGLLGEPALATFQSAVDDANRWIDAFGIEVFNVETLLLPNVKADTDTVEAELHGSEGATAWYQVLRVWFHEEDTVHTDEEIRIFDED